MRIADCHVHVKGEVDAANLLRQMERNAVESEMPSDLAYQKRTIEADLRILDELGLDEAQTERIMSGTADEVFPARR